MSKICKGCKKKLPLEAFTRSPRNRDGALPKCKACRRTHLKKQWASNAAFRKKRLRYDAAYKRTQRKNDGRVVMWWSARQRAKRNGLEFKIQLEHISIPDVCPVLGIRLKQSLGKRGPSDCSPSLDRLIPSKGYVPGNVAVISHLANRLKTNASAAQLRLVADYIDKFTASAGTWPTPACAP